MTLFPIQRVEEINERNCLIEVQDPMHDKTDFAHDERASKPLVFLSLVDVGDPGEARGTQSKKIL